MVKDIKYIIKRILIGLGIAIALIYLKGGLIADVHAATNGYILYDQNYNVLYSNSSTSQQNINVANVSRVRIKFTDAIASGSTYQLTLKIDLTELNYVPYYNTSGVFINSVGQSSEVATISSTVTPQGSSSFLREAVITYTFKSDTTSSSNFWEGSLTHNDRLTYLNASITVSKIADNTGEQIADSTQQIINNNNSNTTNIINQIEQSQQEQIESQKVCKTDTIDISSISLDNKYLTNQGEVANQNNFGVSDYIQLDSDSTLRVTKVNFNNSCFYDSNKTFISCFIPSSLGSINIPSNAKFLRVTFAKNGSSPILELYHCINGNQALNDSLNEIGATINDDSSLSEDEIGAYIDLDYASDTPISDLILMPLTLLGKYLDGLSGSCSSFNLGSLMGTNLSFPCINPADYLGNDLWNLIDMAASLWLIYNIGMLIIQGYNSITSLHDGFDDLYTPKHADTGYVPKHGGGS